MEPLAGVEPAPGRKGAAQDTTPPRPQTSYRECNTGLDTLLLCLSYSGIKIARVLTGQWVLLAARTDAAVQHPCRCFEKEILCTTQKPQGSLSLRLLMILLYHGQPLHSIARFASTQRCRRQTLV